MTPTFGPSIGIQPSPLVRVSIGSRPYPDLITHCDHTTSGYGTAIFINMIIRVASVSAARNRHPATEANSLLV